MRIILDTEKKTITVPWNYADKLDKMNQIIAEGGGKKKYTFNGYIDELWKECMKDTDKCLKVAEKPARNAK